VFAATLNIDTFGVSGRVTQSRWFSSVKLQLQLASILTVSATDCAVESMKAGPEMRVMQRLDGPVPSWRIVSPLSAIPIKPDRGAALVFGRTVYVIVALPTPVVGLVIDTMFGVNPESLHTQLEVDAIWKDPVPPDCGNEAASWLNVTDAIVVNEDTPELRLMPWLLPTTCQ
jgi:hypothetical protein